MLNLTNDEKGALIFRVRILLGCLAVTSILFPSAYQPLLTSLWNLLRSSSIYRASTFETFWTVFWYAAIEVPLTVIFLRNPQWRLAINHTTNDAPRSVGNNTIKQTSIRRPRGMRRPSRRLMEALIYVLPLFAMDLTMIKKYSGVPPEAMLESGNWDIQTSSDSFQGLRQSFVIPTLHNFSWQSPLQSRRALPAAAPTSRRVVRELVVALIIYDFLFFVFHWALHAVPGLRNFHARHHQHEEIHPQVTNQLSVFERLGLVMLANFSLNVVGSHVLTRTAFVPLFVWLLVEIHCGLDLPWGYEKILPAGWAGGARKHARHHRQGDGGYEPFFSFWDLALQRARAKMQLS